MAATGKKVFAILGATGQQGSSIARYVLSDPELNKEYSVRALTRNTSSVQAQHLKKLGADVVAANSNDVASLQAAFSGVHTVFSITNPEVFRADCADLEFREAKSTVDAAVAQGVSFFIYSSLPSIANFTHGKYHFLPDEGKALAETYIRSLSSLRSAFYAPGWFMENFANRPFTPFTKQADGSWALTGPVPGTTRIPLVATTADTGKYVGAILADQDRFAGQTVYGATGLYSLDEIAASMARASGKPVVYSQTASPAAYEALVPEPLGPMFANYFYAAVEVGCFGPDTAAHISRAGKEARGTLTMPDEYFALHPPKLE